MSFSEEWEEKYGNHQQMVVWPWSDLVSFVHRYSKVGKTKPVKVLELGCGAGANIPFFQSLGVDYYAIDGSTSVIKLLKEKFPKYAEHLVVGDFTKNIPFEDVFDVIVDRAAVTHNTTQDIKHTIQLIKTHLSRGGGQFIGIDWFSTKHDCYSLGKTVQNDINTKFYDKDSGGLFGGYGIVHFSDESHIKSLFHDFKICVLEEKIEQYFIPEPQKYASWNFVVEFK